MLRNIEISDLMKKIGSGRVINLSSGIRCEVSDVAIGGVDAESILFSEADTVVSFDPPAQIMGKPFDASCLNGVLKQVEIDFPKKIIQKISNGRIVGWRTAIDDQGQLYAPYLLSDPNELAKFTQYHRPDFEGCVLSSAEGSLKIYYACRDVAHKFSGVSLFVPYLEQGNYGSFICRGLPALLFLKDNNVKIERIVVPEKTPWVLEALSLLELDTVPILGVREICGDLFEELLVVAVPDKEGLYDSKTLDRLKSFTAKIASNDIGSAKIYVSRRLSYLWRPHYRVLTNEHVIEQVVQSNGFQIVHPEAWNFRNQVSIFCSAAAILGPSGSGMLNSIFARKGTRVVDMESFHGTVRQHAKLYSSTQKNYAFLFGEIEEASGSPAFRPWSVGESFVREALHFLNTD